MYCFMAMFSDSMCSVWPLDVARPVIRSVVLHSRLFWMHGEHPPARASHRILRTWAHYLVSSIVVSRTNPPHLAAVAGLTCARCASQLLPDAAREVAGLVGPRDLAGSIDTPILTRAFVWHDAMVSELRYIPCLMDRYKPSSLGAHAGRSLVVQALQLGIETLVVGTEQYSLAIRQCKLYTTHVVATPVQQSWLAGEKLERDSRPSRDSFFCQFNRGRPYQLAPFTESLALVISRRRSYKSESHCSLRSSLYRSRWPKLRLSCFPTFPITRFM